MTTPLEPEPLAGRSLLEAARKALATVCDGVDASALERDTPLAALLFDSLMAVKFIATLEADLGVDEVPFEQWLAQHSERADALTIGSLVEWLRTTPQLRSVGTDGARREATPRAVGDGG